MGKIGTKPDIWLPPLIGEFMNKAENAQRWIIPHILPFNGQSLISGQRKLAHKTWMADFLALVVAQGIEVENVKALVTGPVIYFEEEGTFAGTRERWRGFERTFGFSLSEATNLYYVFRGNLRLDDNAWVEKIIKAVDEIKPLLVVFDAITYMHQKDENKTHEMRVVVDAIHRIRQRNTACLFLAHTSSEGSRDQKLDDDLGVRGSKVVLDAYDSHLALRRFSDSQDYVRCKIRQREGSQRMYKVVWDIRTQINEETQIEEVMWCKPSFTEMETGPAKPPSEEMVLTFLTTAATMEKIRGEFSTTRKYLEPMLNKLLAEEKVEQSKVGRTIKYRRVEQCDKQS